MGLFSWLAMIGVFLLVKQITEGRLSCNIFTAAIAATILFSVNFGFTTFLTVEVQPSMEKYLGETASSLIWFLAWVTALPMNTLFVIVLCSLVLPGFKVRAIPKKKMNVEAKLKGIKPPELKQKIRAILSETRKPTQSDHFREMISCSILFFALFSGVSVLGPVFGGLGLFALVAYIQIKRTPSPVYGRRYDPTRDIYNPSNPLNKYDVSSPYYRYRQ